MEDLVKKVFYNLRPKVIDGQTLTGKMFCELADSYVQAINTDAIPTISTAWERVIDSEIRSVYETACLELNESIQEIV